MGPGHPGQGPPPSTNEGHTFLEALVNDHWIVLDSVTSEYAEDYGTQDPVICLKDPAGRDKTYFIYHQGLDHWTMKVHSNKDNREQMGRFARTYPLDTIKVPHKTVKNAKNRRKTQATDAG